jgi:hypothetical protein
MCIFRNTPERPTKDEVEILVDSESLALR